jgi:hypothetical protein
VTGVRLLDRIHGERPDGVRHEVMSGAAHGQRAGSGMGGGTAADGAAALAE